MNLKEIYIDKKNVIEKAVSKAMNTIYNSIENDEDYSLSTDETIELCEELITRYCKGGYKELNGGISCGCEEGVFACSKHHN